MNHSKASNQRFLSLHSTQTMPELPAVKLRLPPPPEHGEIAVQALAMPLPAKPTPPASLIAASIVLSLTAMAIITGLVGAISGDDDWMLYGFASAVILAALTLMLSLFVIDDLGS